MDEHSVFRIIFTTLFSVFSHLQMQEMNFSIGYFFYQSENTEVPVKTLHFMGWILVRILGMLGFQSLRTCAKANGSKSLLLRLARTKWFEQCSPKIKGKNKSEEKCVLLSALLKGEAEIPTGECPSTAYTWRAQENLPLRRSSRSPIWSPRFRWDAL